MKIFFANKNMPFIECKYFYQILLLFGNHNSVVRIAARPTTLQNLFLFTQGHSSYNIYIAETNKHQSHRGHIVYCMKSRNENIQNT